MDEIFKALNDPARRAILDTLRQQDGQTLSDLEARFDMTRFGVMKHLGVLEAGKLITTKKVGRFKYHYLNALPLQEVMDRWIEPLLAQPAARGLLDLKAKLEGTAKMSDKPDFRTETYIKCTQDALWEALTTPEGEVNYHFMCNRIERDGNQLIYYTSDGTVMLICTEIELQPKSKILATFEPRFGGEEEPHSKFAYLIEVEGPYCKLAVEHYDIPDGHEGVADGWTRMIAGLKSYLETGLPTKFGPAAETA